MTDLFCTSFPQQFNDGGDRVAPDDGVINQHHTLSCKVVRQNSKLLCHSQLSQARVWLNECSPNVAVLAQDLHVRKPSLRGEHREGKLWEVGRRADGATTFPGMRAGTDLLSIAQGGRSGRFGHSADQVYVCWSLDGELPTTALPHSVHHLSWSTLES